METQHFESKQKNYSKNFETERKTSAKPPANLQWWYSFVGTCTLHGLHYVFQQNRCRFRRVLWFLLILSQILWFCFQTNLLLKKYFSYPVQTKVKLVYERSPEFPSVTVCNFNPFKQSRVSPKHENLLRYAVTHQRKDDNREMNESFWNQFSMVKLNMTREYLNSGFTMDDLIIECFWSGSTCSAENFTSTLTSFGLCHTFNSGTYTDSVIITYPTRLAIYE